MIDFTVRTDIARTPEDVFEYLADPDRLGEWQANVVSVEVLGGGPVRRGSRLRELRRGPGGRDVAQVVEVVAFEPGQRFGLQVVEGKMPIDGDIALERRGDGTRMSFRVHGDPRPRILQPVLRIALRRSFAGACQRLAENLQSR